MYRILGIVLILLAIGLAVVPRLTDCESHGHAIELANGATIPMKCHWSGIAEIGVAVPMYIIGAIMTTNRNRSILPILSLFGIVLGVLAIAFPTKLIGVCQAPAMICDTAMRPALILLGGSAAVLSGLGLILSPPVKSSLRGALLMLVAYSKKKTSWKAIQS